MISLDPMWLFSAVAGGMIVAAAIDEWRQIKIMSWCGRGDPAGGPVSPACPDRRVATPLHG